MTSKEITPQENYEDASGFSPERLPDGRIKIPISFADYMVNPRTNRPYDRSTLVRYNQGTRSLGLSTAIQVLEIFKQIGHPIEIVDIMPGLKQVKPYLCGESSKD